MTVPNARLGIWSKLAVWFALIGLAAVAVLTGPLAGKKKEDKKTDATVVMRIEVPAANDSKPAPSENQIPPGRFYRL